MTNDDEEEATYDEKGTECITKDWFSITNYERTRQENVEITLSSSRLEEQEVVFHEFEVTEWSKNKESKNTKKMILGYSRSEKLIRKIELDLHLVDAEAVDENDSLSVPDNIKNAKNWVSD